MLEWFIRRKNNDDGSSRHFVLVKVNVHEEGLKSHAGETWVHRIAWQSERC